MKSFMESQAKDSVFQKSNHAGVMRVMNGDGDYAFLMESNSIQYQIERMCDLIQVSMARVWSVCSNDHYTEGWPAS